MALRHSDFQQPACSETVPPSAFERWLLRRGLDALGRPPLTFVLWIGEQVCASDEAPRARVHLRKRAVLRKMLLHPDLVLGEAYTDGSLEVEGDLSECAALCFGASNGVPAWARALSGALGWRPLHNTRRRGRRNVQLHYDLGNDFYSLWLDERMVYSCAYFETPGVSLEQAQLAKLDHVCRKLRLRQGERVVETGCGWGALALHMAERYGVTVRAFNVSAEQVRWAREQAKQRGLSSRVEFVDDDYRSASGSFDAFVSVGMLEHVGPPQYRTLGRVIDRCLAPHGRGLLHFIGHTRRMQTSLWIDRYVFPGGYTPALSEMLPVFEPQKLEVVDLENLRRHYVRTLEHWLERFEKAADRVTKMTDERFVRLWRVYLAGSIAAFRTGSNQLYQVLFARAGGTRLPWTRDDLYVRG